MAVLTGWSTPTTVPAITEAGPFQSMRHLNGYFVTMANGNGAATNVSVRYATDPKGTWTSASMPALPSGVTTVDPNGPYGVDFDGTNYATAALYYSGSTYKARILHTTDLGGTWSSYEFDTANRYRPADIAYLNGEWVMVGIDYNSGPYKPFIATCSTPNGTWTFDTTASGTGLSTSGFGATDGYSIRRIHYADGDYTYLYTRLSTFTSGINTSTSLSSGWGAPSSFPGAPTYAPLDRFLAYVNGYWFTCVWLNAGARPYMAYATNPAGTWSTVSATDLDLDNNFSEVHGIAYDGEQYVIAGIKTRFTSSWQYERFSGYLVSSGSPAGTYTTVTSGLATGSRSGTHDVVFVAPVFVTTQNAGGIRYSNDTQPLPSTGPTYLRQSQSPVRTPSRVRGVDLRQSQTPRVTR